ncbi:MAG TPA: DUF4252 domain-containing protein [Prolixibacteraceae bacterium]|nr:DUF4252 domain-containing protein [Prolixibacteraceae bacterium]
MKKLVFPFLFALFFGLNSCSDDQTLSTAFHRYSGQDGIVSITIPGFLIHMASWSDGLSNEEKELLKNIDKVKILAVDDPDKFRNVNFHQEFHSLLKQGKYEELINIREEKQEVSIVGVTDSEANIREMLILVGGEDNALIYVKGNLKPELLSQQVKLDSNGHLSGLGKLYQR